MCRSPDRLPFLILLVVLCPLIAHADPGEVGDPRTPRFVDVTPAAMQDMVLGSGIAWGDYDGDGDEDLYVTDYRSGNRLFRNDGDDQLSDVTLGSVLGDAGHGRGAAWADMDNDGDLDLYLANEDDPNRLYRNDGEDGFADVTTGPLGSSGPGLGVAWADYDSDGNVDLYTTNLDATGNRLFRNLGDGEFADVTNPVVGVGPSDAAAWGDYDDDGDPDLYVAIHGAANRLLRNDQVQGFQDVTIGPLGDDGGTEGVAWGDCDRDGDLDLYFATEFGGGTLLRNDGDTAFTDVTIGPLGDGASYQVTWGDYDNDSDLDLLVTPCRLMRNDGASGFADVTASEIPGGAGGIGAAWADYDNDGDLDVVMTTINGLFRNDSGTDNHWLLVDLRGNSSNAVGIGARVRVVTDNVSSTWEVSGSDGFCSQNTLVTHFGLGPSVLVDTLEVRWPSGTEQHLLSVRADHRVLVVEPETTGAIDAIRGAMGEARLRSVPNPFNPMTKISFNLHRSGQVRLVAVNAVGQVVRELTDVGLSAGNHSIVWDGRDNAGERLPSGQYFYQLVVDGSVAGTQKAVILK